MPYCQDLLSYARRPTREVRVGHLGLGAWHPIRVQSMITSDTRDTAACVAETLALAEAGCEIVRITAQTKAYAANLEHIAREVRAAGCQVPLVADIHFKPDAAMEAAKWVEKIRVNPGNYSDSKKFAIRDYDTAQYHAELERIREEFTPLVRLCKELGRAMRIGTNHGSLSDRIMNRYGDTPLGMVESALEFARIARDHDYHQLVFSMKASNPKVMIEAYRLLAARLAAEGPDWNYPLHLGVTEAGDGEDGRIKSAIGIGSLLADGIGDTIRVSLTEDSIHEIPVAQELVRSCSGGSGGSGCGVPPQAVAAASRGRSSLTRSLTDDASSIHINWDQVIKTDASYLPHWKLDGGTYDPFSYERRKSAVITVMGHQLGGDHTLRVFTTEDRWNTLAHKIPSMGDFKPEVVFEQSGVLELDPRDEAAMADLNAAATPQLITVADGVGMEVIHAFRLLAARAEARHPILLKDTLHGRHGSRHGSRCGSRCGFQPQSPIDFQPQLNHDCQQSFLNPKQPIQKSHATFLPHWTQQGGVYAVTFRLANSLPVEVIEAYRRERARLEAAIERAEPSSNLPESQHLLADLTKQLAVLYESSIGAALDTGSGDCHLRDEPVASILLDSLRHFDGQRYGLIAWCIMPNHVHLLIQPFDGYPLAEILHSIKSFSANAANQLLGIAGAFWHKESYDHLIRDGEDYRNQLRYLLKNPESAGLVDWPWRGSIYGDSWGEVRAGADGGDLRLEAAATDAATALTATLSAACNLGSLLCDGIGDAILVREEAAPGASLRLAYNILQAAGARIFKTDYVACPSCGRTLFNLQHTTQKIRAATGHLKGVRIAIMGCIVNGPGEMADADFGYVGGAPGKINLYVGKTPVQFNLPEAEAVARLIELIRDHGKWLDPPPILESNPPN